MTIDTLKSCRSITFEIELIEERLTRLRSAMERATSILQVKGGNNGSQVADKIGDQTAKYIDLEETHINALIALEAEISSISNEINKLPDNQQKIMKLRYFKGLSWKEIAKRTNYTQDHCIRLQKSALELISEK